MVVLLVLLSHLVGKFQAIHLGHQPVGNQHADRALFYQLQGFRCVVDDAYVAIPGISQRAANHHTAEFRVVYYEDGKVQIWHCYLLLPVRCQVRELSGVGIIPSKLKKYTFLP